MRMQKIILVALLCIALTAPAMAAADLNVTKLHPNLGELFSHSGNTVDVTVTNDGDSDPGDFNLEYVSGGFTLSERIAIPPAGESTAVAFTAENEWAEGDEVTIRVTADPESEITEEDETNNVMEVTKTVVNNGYRGKRFTDGEDITTVKDFELQGDVLWSEGDSYYLSGYYNKDWTTYAANWTAEDLPMPEGATVSDAYLYIPYNFDKGPVIPDEVSLSFNEADYTPDALYTDQKGFGGYNFPYGMVVYDVTDGFDADGNFAVLSNNHEGGGNVTMYGMMLVVVYADDSLSQKRILINEGYDLIMCNPVKYATTPDQAIAYAPFTGDAIDTTDLGRASLITFAPSAGDVGEGSSLLFNGEQWENPWTFAGETQIGVADCYVTSALKSEDNQAEFRDNGEKLSAAVAMLVADYGEPELNVTKVHPNLNEVFSHSANTVAVTVTNDGNLDSGAFTLKFECGDYLNQTEMDSIAANKSMTYTFTDPTIRAAGDEVLIRATADAENVLTEVDEANNVLEITKTVVNNGYRGKRFSDGKDITTVKDFELQGDVVWSEGDSYYLSGYYNKDWTTYAANWTAEDLPMPEGATVSDAYLYIPYNFDQGPVIPDEASLSFNEAEFSPDALYTDQKGFGGYNFPYGMVVYDVTDGFDADGNTAVLTNNYEGGGNVSMYGMMLVVVYYDENLSRKTILINEGFDLLQAAEKYATTPEQATAYAPFTGDAIKLSETEIASLITFAPSAGDVGEGSSLLFNGEQWENPWTFAGETQIGVADCYVTSALKSEDNQAEFRDSGEKFSAAFAMLVISAPDEPEPTPEPTTAYSRHSSSGGRSQVSAEAASHLGPGENVSLSLSNSAISGVDITAKEYIAKIMLTAERKGSLPSDIGSPEGEIYQYIEVRLYQASDDDLEKAVVEFSIPASWLDEHGLSASDVVLMRYDDNTETWTALPTEMLREAGDMVWFSANTPGFSYFAITAESSSHGVGVGTDAGPAPTSGIQAEATPLKVTATETTAASPTQQTPLIFAPVLSIPALLMMRKRK